MFPALKKLPVVALTALCLIGCSETRLPPEVPPAYTGEAPEITEGKYAVYETERIFNAPLIAVRRYIEDGNKIVSAMEETDNIKKPVDVVVLSGTWPETDSVRRLEFSDGHYALERVIKNDFPTLFRYQVWNFTAAAGDNLEYAVGQQAWTELDAGRSKLVWTYSLRPNADYKQFFVQRFVNNDMRPLMDRALDAVKKQVDEAFADEAS